jgi:hypothetical protein
MFIDEWSLLVGVTLVTDEISVRQGSYLPDGSGSMNIMAIVTLDEALLHSVMKGLGKVCFGGSVTAVAQLGLSFGKQVLRFLGVMGRVAIQTAHVAAGVRRLGKLVLLLCLTVAAQATGAGLLP